MLQNDLIYWMLFAHLPKWTTLKTNKLIVEILHNQKITFEEFFSLTQTEWIEKYLTEARSQLYKSATDNVF